MAFNAKARLTAAVLAMWAPFLAYGLLAGDARLVRFFPDDAFYYLQPAAAMAASGRPTFDGVHLTNGFQPLNFLLVTAIAAVTGKARLLAATFLVHTALVWAALWCLARAWLLRERDGAGAAAIAVAALPPVTLFLWLSAGTEAAVVVVAVAVLAVTWAGEGPGGSWRRGLALAALVLARLDAALALLPFALASLATVARASRDARPAAVRSALVTWGVPFLIVGAYFLINVRTMGHVLPISVHVKLLGASSQPHTWDPSTRGSVSGWLIVLAPLAACAAVAVRAGAAWWRPYLENTAPRADAVRDTVALLGAGAILYYVYLAVGVRLVFRWYFALPLAVLMVTVMAEARDWRRRSWLACALAAVNVASSANVLLWAGSRPASASFQLREVARRVEKSVEPGGVVAVADAGAVGFFCDRRVVNVDGLASDYEYVDQFLRRGRLVEYFAREGVTHYLVRDTHLVNRDAVLARSGEPGQVIFDRRLVLRPDRERWRYEIPGQFTVILFAVD
jgi:hypothetical protein